MPEIETLEQVIGNTKYGNTSRANSGPALFIAPRRVSGAGATVGKKPADPIEKIYMKMLSLCG
jgi:hypothetical protein